MKPSSLNHKMRSSSHFAAAVTFVALISIPAAAQNDIVTTTPSATTSPSTPPSTSTSSSKVETVQGKVIVIKKIPSSKTSTGGYEILLQSAAGDYKVVLAPNLLKSFARKDFNSGDQVMAVGVTISLQGKKKVFEAQELRKTATN